MLFNSYSFIFMFLPLTLIFYYGIWHIKDISKAKYVILISSLIFYGLGAKRFIILLLFSMCFNYLIGNRIIEDRKKSKIYLALGVACNLALLLYYKYFEFMIQNFNFFFNSSLEISSISLPLGISFFTFTQIAFLVDMYRSDTRKKYSKSDYGILVSFFPHLIAGPLLHHNQFIPQWAKLSLPVDYEKIYKGLIYFSIGLTKKVIFADPIGQYANVIFANGAHDCLEAWLGSLSYSLQLYLDFSGYSDMAIGISFLLQIQIPQNFNAPYIAHNIQDFWRRWHISLSDFLKNYIYIPLGGNRFGTTRIIINILTTFLLGGLWHGANWTFVIWGGLHGLGILFHRVFKKLGLSLPTSIAWLVTMIFVNFCWVFFKSDTVSSALMLIGQMCNFSEFLNAEISIKSLSVFSIIGVVLCGAFIFFPTEVFYEKISKQKEWSIVTGIILSIALFAMRRETIFLYFNF